MRLFHFKSKAGVVSVRLQKGKP